MPITLHFKTDINLREIHNLIFRQAQITLADCGYPFQSPWLSSHLIMTLCAKDYISTVLSLSLCVYLCWWTIIPRGYHPTGSQYLGTNMVYWIYLCLRLIIIKANINLSQSYVTLANFGYPVSDPLVNLLSKTLTLFGFPIFDYGRT